MSRTHFDPLFYSSPFCFLHYYYYKCYSYTYCLNFLRWYTFFAHFVDMSVTCECISWLCVVCVLDILVRSSVRYSIFFLQIK